MTTEEIREKFEGNIAISSRAKNGKGKYINGQIEHQWKGFQWAYQIVLDREKIIKDLTDANFSMCEKCFAVITK